jgi:hypothetical protein
MLVQLQAYTISASLLLLCIAAQLAPCFRCGGHTSCRQVACKLAVQVLDLIDLVRVLTSYHACALQTQDVQLRGEIVSLKERLERVQAAAAAIASHKAPNQ